MWREGEGGFDPLNVKKYQKFIFSMWVLLLFILDKIKRKKSSLIKGMLMLNYMKTYFKKVTKALNCLLIILKEFVPFFQVLGLYECFSPPILYKVILWRRKKCQQHLFEALFLFSWIKVMVRFGSKGPQRVEIILFVELLAKKKWRVSII